MHIYGLYIATNVHDISSHFIILDFMVRSLTKIFQGNNYLTHLQQATYFIFIIRQ